MADETYKYNVVIGIDVLADEVDSNMKSAENSISRWEKRSIESIKKVQKAMEILNNIGFGSGKLDKDTQQVLLFTQKLARAYIQTGKAKENADAQAARNTVKQNEIVQASNLKVRNLQLKNLNDQRKADEAYNASRVKNAQDYAIKSQRLQQAELKTIRDIQREEERLYDRRNRQRAKEERDRERARSKKLDSLDAAGSGMLAAGTGLTAAITAPIIAGAYQAQKAFADLETQVANISTIKPEINFKEVYSELNNLSTIVPQTASQLGEGLYNIFSSINVTQKEGLQLLEQFAKGATAAQTDTEAFGTSILGVLNAYKLEVKDAAHISDVFFNTVNLGVVTGEELAHNLGVVTSAAKAAGVSFDELGALIVGVTKEGGPAAQNINNLANFLNKLTDDKAQEKLQKLFNISIVDKATGKFKDIVDVLSELKDKMKDLTEAEQNAALQEIFPDVQARQGAQVLISQLDNVKEALKVNKETSGAAEAAYKKMSMTWAVQSKLLSNIVTFAFAEIGTAIMPHLMPMIIWLAKTIPGAVKSTINAFKSLPDGVQKAIIVFLALIATIGPIVAALGALAMAVAAVIPGLLALTGATTVGAALATLLPIIAGIVAIIAALVAGVTAAVGIIFTLSEAWSQGWGEIASVVAIAIGAIISGISPIIGLPILIGSTLYTIYKLWETNFGGIRDFTAKVWEGIKSLVSDGLAAVISLVNQIGGRILGWWKQNGDSTKSVFTSVYNYLYSVVKNFLDTLEQLWKTYGPIILSTVEYVWGLVKSSIMFVLNYLLDALSFWINVFKGNWSEAWEIFLRIVKRAAFALVAIWKFIQENSLRVLVWLVKLLWEYGNKASLAIVKAIGAGLVWLVKSFIDLPNILIRVVPQLFSAGLQIGSAIWEGVKSAFSGGDTSTAANDAASVPFDITKLFSFTSPENPVGDNKGGILDTINDKLKSVKETIDNIGNASEKSAGKTNGLSNALGKATKHASGSKKEKKAKATGNITSKGQSILEAAEALGVSPVALATLISYETAGTFDPWKKGPTTQWGVHRGLIQWGEPQRKEYGITQGMSFDAQMDKVVKYMRDRGVRPGASLTTMYKAVNGGNVTVSENASDGYGTIRTHVAKMQRQHKKSAVNKLFGGKNPQSLSRGDIRDSVDIEDRFEINPEIEKLKQLQSAQRDVIKTYQEMEFELATLGLSQKDFGMASLGEANKSLARLDKIKDAQKFLNSEYDKSTEKLEEMSIAVDGNLAPLQDFDLSIQRMARDLGVSVDYLKDLNPNLEKTRENLQKIAEKQLAEKAAANLKEFTDQVAADIQELNNKIELVGVTDSKKKRSIEARQQLNAILNSDKYKNASESDRDTIEGEFWSRFLKENQLTALEKAAEATGLFNDKVKELKDSLVDTNNLTERQRLELELTNGSLKDLTQSQKDQLLVLQDQVDAIKKSEEAQKRVKELGQEFGSIFADSFEDLFDKGVMGALETLGRGLKQFFKNLLMQIVGGIATQVQNTIANMVSKLFGGKGTQANSTGANIGGAIQGVAGSILTPQQNGVTSSGNIITTATNNAMQNIVPNLVRDRIATIPSLTNNVNATPLGTGSRARIVAGQPISDITSQVTTGAGKFSFGALGKQLGAMAPMLGMQGGMALGGQSISGQILGGIGGLAGGVLGGIATGAINAGTMLGGVFGAGGALSIGGLSAAMSATVVLAPIAGALLIGAYLLNRNKQRRKDETTRNQAMLDAFGQLDKLIADVNNNKLDGDSALSQADDIRKNYVDQMSQLKDKKTRRIALADVSRIDSKIATLKSAAAAQEQRKAKLANLVPTFADGGSTSNFISSNYKHNPLGYVTGAGTEKSDSILARLSNKEYVLDAQTTRNIGVKNLDALRKNKGLNFTRILRFADGGFAENEPSIKIADTSSLATTNSGSGIKIGVSVINNITQDENGTTVSTEAYLVTPEGKKKIDDIVAQNIIENRSAGKIYNALKGVDKGR